jgi:N-hydroxyarylamine O-acetyltransferase
VNARDYLARIGYDGPLEPTAETLARLQRAHMLAVPFENLDIHLGRPLRLDRQANFAKLVTRRRGGWCYELNSMFAWLLEQLGYRVTLLGARVEGSEVGSLDLAHLLLRVDLDRPWIADVGFGESSLEPIPLENLPNHVIVPSEEDDLRVAFSLTPRSLEEFWQMCRYQQTSPESWFVKVRLCTIALPDGRLTLRDRTLSERRGGERRSRRLGSDEEWHAVLRDRFGVVL